MYDKLKAIATYCGEDFDPTDPSRILRVVRDFMRLFEKSLTDIGVRAECHKVCSSHTRRQKSKIDRPSCAVQPVCTLSSSMLPARN